MRVKYEHLGASKSQVVRRGLRRFQERGVRRGTVDAVFAIGAALEQSLVFAARYVEWIVVLLLPARTFVLDGDEYRYFVHPYNATWRNERAVEIPIVRRILERSDGRRVLEIGNVLGHYFRERNEVVDKYEPGPHVVNLDILEFRPEQPYDLIVSISTLEHVGFDEEVRDPGKIPLAVAHIRSLLAPGGRAIVTLPLGYNPAMDELLRRGALGLDGANALLRVGDREWRQVALSELGRPAYGTPFPGANALVIGTIDAA